MVKLICDGLKRRDILQHLIEPAANALPILGDKARDAAGSDDANHQNDTIQNSTDESHRRLATEKVYSYAHRDANRVKYQARTAIRHCEKDAVSLPGS